MNLIIRTETLADYEAVSNVLMAAFGGEEEAQLVARLRRTPDYLPELALVAV